MKSCGSLRSVYRSGSSGDDAGGCARGALGALSGSCAEDGGTRGEAGRGDVERSSVAAGAILNDVLVGICGHDDGAVEGKPAKPRLVSGFECRILVVGPCRDSDEGF